MIIFSPNPTIPIKPTPIKVNEADFFNSLRIKIDYLKSLFKLEIIPASFKIVSYFGIKDEFCRESG